MNNPLKPALTVAAIMIALLVSSEPLFARGGAASIMNSPGYQRRLQESRRQLPVRSTSAIRHKSRHRHRHWRARPVKRRLFWSVGL